MNPDRQRGFSAPEMLVVLLITALLAMITLPNIAQRIRDYQTEAAARQVLGDLQAARMRAFSDNVRFRVDFTNGATAYTLQRRDPLTLSYSNETTYSLPEDTSFTTVIDPEFVPTGLVNSPGSITVVNGQGRAKTITVTAAGRMSVL